MRVLSYAIAAVFVTAPLALPAAEAPAKEAVCKACHGEGGKKPLMGAYPKLAGQNKEYLVSSLKAYRDGQRQGGQSAVMTGQAKMLSDDDINALAEYYSKQ
ncbi:c-type cytochrome [Pleionea litopenaei]|uniref:Cytochrome c n=1 Tax=Pleionea litopenaei TaxID=3070815 RepID=A0AA51RSB8_9GAMM|nr:cytochrome c [Pleionea sp. HL-JVS1]WMS86763.1 cytochrome c [Pleionea sp. HL-JVS1]